MVTKKAKYPSALRNSLFRAGTTPEAHAAILATLYGNRAGIRYLMSPLRLKERLSIALRAKTGFRWEQVCYTDAVKLLVEKGNVTVRDIIPVARRILIRFRPPDITRDLVLRPDDDRGEGKTPLPPGKSNRPARLNKDVLKRLRAIVRSVKYANKHHHTEFISEYLRLARNGSYLAEKDARQMAARKRETLLLLARAVLDMENKPPALVRLIGQIIARENI